MFQGLKQSLALQAQDETLRGTSSSMQHLLYLILIVALATARNWVRWTEISDYLAMPMLQIPRFLENQVFKASPNDYGCVPPYRDGSYASKSTGWTQQADFPNVRDWHLGCR